MKLAIVLFILMTSSLASALPNSCIDAFGQITAATSEVHGRKEDVEDLRARVSRFFDLSRSSARKLSDKADAVALLETLEKNGSALDLQIAEIYLSIR